MLELLFYICYHILNHTFKEGEGHFSCRAGLRIKMKENNAKYYTAAITDKGKRKLNEDSYLVLEQRYNNNHCIFAMVADGVGGFKRSEIASNYLKESLELWFKKMENSFFVMTTEEIKKKLDSEIKNIHKFLILNSERADNPLDMTYGTTITGILIINSRYIICHVGDSRCYMSYRKTVRQVTKDQTQYQLILDQKGPLPTDNKEVNNSRAKILQCIGKGKVTPRYYEGVLADEYNVLLCTDGFYRKLSEKEITIILNSDLDMYQKLLKAKNELRNRAESDDITAILIRKMYEKG